MKRRREEKINREISPSPTQRTVEISTGDMFGKIYIPMDITVEILKKLPSKSLVRFRCVSKQWSSIISYNKSFIDSIVTRSLTQPQRYQAIFQKMSSSGPYFFTFSSTDPTIINTEPVLIPGSTKDANYNYVRGLITCWSPDNSSSLSIYNPTTRQSLYLPELTILKKNARIRLFGYDPIGDQYKVLYPLELVGKQAWHVFTLRGQNKWRKIEGTTRLHLPCQPTVCINGIIYYRALTHKECDSTFVLMSFDVKSEKFDQVKAPKTLMTQCSTLIDYQGKLGFVCCEMGMEIWVMENVETQEWLMIFFDEMDGFENWPILGVNRCGEIVFLDEWYHSSKVLYYNSERKSMRCVEIEDNTTLGHFCHYMKVVPDYVENTMSLN